MPVPDTPVPKLTVRMFGRLDIAVGASPLHRSVPAKVRLLLAMLAVQPGGKIHRTQAAARLWPAKDRQQAAVYLNRSVWQLRKALGPEAVRLPDPESLERELFFDWMGADVDLHAFDAAMESGSPDALRSGVSLYRGPLLEGLADVDDEHDLWILEARGQRLRAYQDALKRLAAEARTMGDHDGAVAFLRQSVEADPFWEPGQRALLEALERNGQRSAALDHYRDLEALFRKASRGLPAPETTAVYQAIAQRARTEHAAPSATDIGQGAVAYQADNIPYPLTGLIGQTEVLSQAETCLRVQRLLTLTGPGGVGKTRISLALAARMKEEFAHGAAFVDLAPLSDPALVTRAVASALGVQEQTGREILQTLRDFLRKKSLLLILDNCEHVRLACAQLARALLEASPRLRVLATSRQALGLFGETVRQVPSLAVPDPDSLPAGAAGVDEACNSPAVRLFVERADAAGTGFVLDASNSVGVARVCRRLDGIPLAIELAAAHCRTRSIELLSAQLDSMYALLTEGDTTALPRQQTLSALIDWSYQLLTLAEQSLLRRLSVFRGSWTLAAVEAVCAESDFGTTPLADLHGDLMRQSLIFAMPGPDGANRFRMLETVREFCADRLAASEDEQDACSRHCAEYLRVAEEASPKLRGAEQPAWLVALERDHDNLRTGLQWAIDNGRSEIAMRLAAALWRFWSVRGYLHEAQSWMQRVLALDPPDGALRLKILTGAGSIAHQRAEYDAAKAHFEESLRLSKSLNDSEGIAASLASLANVAQRLKEFEQARELFDEALEIFERIEDDRGVALTTANLAVLSCRETAYDRAIEYHEKSIAMFRRIGDAQHIALGLTNQASTLISKGDFDSAGPLLAESIALNVTLKNARGIAHCLSNFVTLAVKQRQMERAAVLVGAEAALRERARLPLPPAAVEEYRRDEESARAAIGEQKYQCLCASGRAMTTEEAVSFACAIPPSRSSQN